MPSKPSTLSISPPIEPRRRSALRRSGATASAASTTNDAADGAPVPWVKRPLRWVQDVFTRQLQLERRGMQIHVTLAPPLSQQTLAGTPSALGTGGALREAHQELRALLDHHPKARATMRHLAFLESSLGRHGSRVFTRVLPVPVLKRCLEQLDLLAAGDDTAGIAELRHRLQSALAKRASAPSDFGVSQPVHVSEASHSLFDEMERSWTGTMPSPAKPGA